MVKHDQTVLNAVQLAEESEWLKDNETMEERSNRIGTKAIQRNNEIGTEKKKERKKEKADNQIPFITPLSG